MTEQEIKDILTSIALLWQELTPNEVKSLFRILAAHGHYPTCSACGKPISDFKTFSWDHVIARSIGGADDIKNMTPMHQNCNFAKGSIVDPTYFGHVDPELLHEMKPLCKGNPP